MRNPILFFTFTLFMGNFIFGQSIPENQTNNQKTASVVEKREYNPTSATLLSLLIPGAGQMYVDEPERGVLFLLGGIASTVAFFVGSAKKTQIITCSDCPPDSTILIAETGAKSPGLAVIGLVSSLVVSIWSMADASKIANNKNNYGSINSNNSKKNNYNEEERIKKLQEIKKEMEQSSSFSPVLIESQNQLFPGLGLTFRF